MKVGILVIVVTTTIFLLPPKLETKMYARNKFKLRQPGMFYFTITPSKHCNKGQRLAVCAKTLEDRLNHPLMQHVYFYNSPFFFITNEKIKIDNQDQDFNKDS